MGKAAPIIGTVAGAAFGQPAIGAAIGGALAGGGVNKAIQTGQNASATPNVPAWLQPQLNYQVDQARSIYDKPYQAYTDPRVAQLNPDELRAAQLARDLSGGADLSYSQGINQQVAQQGLNGPSQATLANYMNPYQQQVMDVSRQRQLEQFDLAKRGLQQEQGATGAFGGSRSGIARGQLYDNFSRGLAEQEAQQLFQGYGDAQNRAFQGAQLAGASAGQYGQQALGQYQSGRQGLQDLSAVGGLSRGLEQQGLGYQYDEFMRAQGDPSQRLQNFQNIVNPIAGLTTGSSSSTMTTGGPNAAQRNLGAATALVKSGQLDGLGGVLKSVWGDRAEPIGPGRDGKPIGNAASGILGWFGSKGWAEGGQVPFGYAEGGMIKNPMQYEENDLPSKMGSFYDMLHSIDTSLDDAEITSPGGPTRGEVRQAWQDEVDLSRMPPEQGYQHGGMVQHYAEGGPVAWWNNYANIGNDRFKTAAPTPFVPPSTEPSLGSQLYTGLNSIVNDQWGGATGVGSRYDVDKHGLGAVGHAVGDVGLTLAGAPLVGKVAAGVGKLGLNAVKLITKIPGVGAGAKLAALSAMSFPDEAKGLVKQATEYLASAAKQEAKAPLDPQDPAVVHKAALKGLQDQGKLSPATGNLASPGVLGNSQADELFSNMTGRARTAPPDLNVSSSTPTTTVTPTTTPPDTWDQRIDKALAYNPAMLAFGTALLQGGKPGSTGLGNAFAAFQTVKADQAAAASKDAQQKITNELDVFKALQYGRQNDINEAALPARINLLNAQSKELLAKSASSGTMSPEGIVALKAGLSSGAVNDQNLEAFIDQINKKLPRTGGQGAVQAQFQNYDDLVNFGNQMQFQDLQ